MNEEKPKFVRFTNDGYDHTSYGEPIPYYVSPLNKLADWWYGHKWVHTNYGENRRNEIRCDRCWTLANFPTAK